MVDHTCEGTRSPPAPKTAERVWLTPEQAVRYLGLPSLKALYQCVRHGKVPAIRLGRCLRFNRAQLDAALLKGR